MNYLIENLLKGYEWLNTAPLYEGPELTIPEPKPNYYPHITAEEDEIEYHSKVCGTLAMLSFHDDLKTVSSLLQSCETPIERVFISAFWLVARAAFPDLGEPNIDLEGKFDVSEKPPEQYLLITPQAQIEDNRVDFALTHFGEWPNFNGRVVREDGTYTVKSTFVRVRAVVECDGHEYHEKTKEQAARDKARDRLLTRKGFRVFRLTGSEIWKSPIECANEIADALYDLAWDAATPSSG